MKVDFFHSLRTIIATLKPEEADVAKKFIIAFDQHGKNKKRNKALQLFKLLHSQPELSFEQARCKVSAGSSPASFERFAKRLRERVLESLHLHINTGRKELYSEPERVQMRLWKVLMQLPLLFDRGLYDEVVEARQRIIGDARRYELYNELLQGLQHKSMMLALQLDEKGHETTLQSTRYYTACRNWVEE